MYWYLIEVVLPDQCIHSMSCHVEPGLYSSGLSTFALMEVQTGKKPLETWFGHDGAYTLERLNRSIGIGGSCVCPTELVRCFGGCASGELRPAGDFLVRFLITQQ